MKFKLKRFLIRTAVNVMILILPTAALAAVQPYIGSDLMNELPEKILNQCGLVAGLLVSAVVYLALQIAKTRAGWETDRTNMMKIIEGQNDAYEALAVSHAKLEGIILAIQTRS